MCQRLFVIYYLFQRSLRKKDRKICINIILEFDRNYLYKNILILITSIKPPCYMQNLQQKHFLSPPKNVSAVT